MAQIANEKRALQEEVERIKNDNRALVEKLLNGEEIQAPTFNFHRYAK